MGRYKFHSLRALKHVMLGFQRGGEWFNSLFNGRPAPSTAIVLAGSGRSGTTWLSNILTSNKGIQQIFEPLNPVWIEGVRQLTGWDNTRLCVRSHYLHYGKKHPDWHEFLERVLTGQVRSTWTDRLRTSYFPDRYLVKVIRANLMLGYLYDHFRPPIIYIIRHPCAVIASRLSLGWYADVQDILAQEALVEDHLRQWITEIEMERDQLGAHAVWWAVENMMAMHDLETRTHFFATFEELNITPENCIRQIFSWLGVDAPFNIDALIKQPSAQSRKGINYRSTYDRLSFWKNHLSCEDTRRILTWTQRLGITHYDVQVLPRELEDQRNEV